MSFPTTLDSLTESITATTFEDASGFEHDLVHNAANAAINDLEAKVGIDSSAVTTSHDYLIQHGVHAKDAAFSGDIAPAQLTANTDNWNPTGLSTASVIRLSTDASRNLTGIAGGADGRVLILFNKGSNPLVLKHDVTSTAANRFYLPGSADYTLGANRGIVLWYDSTDSRWRVAAATASAGSDGSDHNVLDHADANTSPSPSDGDVLTWDATPGEWIAAAPTGGVSNLDDVGDVTITSVADGDVLTYDSGSGDWVNEAPGAAALWNQVINEDGTSFSNFTSSSGTWSSASSVIKQTDTAATFRRAKYNTKVCTGIFIFEAEIQLKNSGTNRIGGLLFGYDGSSAAGMAVRIDEGVNEVLAEADGTQSFLSVSQAIAVDTWYTLRIVGDGSAVSFYLDGTLKGSVRYYTTSVLRDASYVGLYTYQSEVWFRNIKGWTLNQP